ncbi:MAG: hypothetical protein IPJ40_03025 [Saprospirales bacterium]|nr:hypothetical protein [Saprospirales bacterium]
MKLVLPFTLSEKGNELVYREYLAYRMFEYLSPYSFRARFIRVVLSDLHGGRQHELYCILLEDKEETQARLGGTEVKVYNPAPESLDATQLALVGVFNT